VRVLSRLFRRLFLEGLTALHKAGRLAFLGDLAPLADQRAFEATLAPLRRSAWVVFAKRPFAGPQAVLAYLARYTHRVAISNSRLIALDEAGVTFNWKDYRIKGRDRLKTMTLNAAEFIRRFLLQRAAERLSSHPPLRPVRRNGSSAQHRARPPIARRARGLARALARQGGQRGRNSFAGASMSVLRRPHDHRRDIRRRAPRALAIVDPDQDRHLMIDAALLSASQCRSPSLPAARRNIRALSSTARQSFSQRRAHARPSQDPPQKSSSSSFPPRSIPATSPEVPRALRPRPKKSP
jgi:hypothetical protein